MVLKIQLKIINFLLNDKYYDKFIQGNMPLIYRLYTKINLLKAFCAKNLQGLFPELFYA